MNQDEYNKILNDYVDLILEVMLMDLMIALGVEQETNQIKLPDYEEYICYDDYAYKWAEINLNEEN